MFIGPLTVVDYAAIEARVVAWLAGEEWALEAFRDGRDIYVETAERMGGLTRFQGKVAVLALGYNGGVNSLMAMAGAGEYYHPRTGKPLNAGVLGAAQAGVGVMNMLTMDEQMKVLDEDDKTVRLDLVQKALMRHVQFWRRANPRIVKLWEIMEEAIDSGGRVGSHLKITRRNDSMKMHLPSGRAIHYHGVKWERYVVIDPKTGKKVFKEGWRYNDPKRSNARIGTYGGRLVENATQAIARDVLAEAIVRLDEAGYPVVGHVHDEVIVESTEIEDITRLMVETPKWGRGLPLDAEGFVCDRYRKG
jgi:DNA polymerase